ncbi:hypothetical protein GCM10010523_07750 [Paenarthrobacter ilicis]
MMMWGLASSQIRMARAYRGSNGELLVASRPPSVEPYPAIYGLVLSDGVISALAVPIRNAIRDHSSIVRNG